ncbi:tRNA preQ1(34) S-adenosylmethionine ribosyltransferase-isomerase QueA [Geosporobacter ferrireducens]|uniref:S-adenosylmethionine:tRNA ribosyltransferase-isomerase n=1 Tax=Geosporobacter ferrireducens TaxID=1424294 RepID=A0A1D8GPI7_9FIRM|nr:tRNA preQ1(34) S-adenosylmethionine ribosyltransferase-isomerase QueA [Geosporobacter ferrireducens]AOT72815.1 tRNA preQ1(34) S-adenosylmethionine ribosyltransferase-isomerase QueA [Geosporobacter ferrireducens]MTI55214.1 tRNA preQ1(34) S-adenosylmethionine ribosyltransferase-isomerase QueA [Geosporobacter ferrireducens]
MQKKDFYFDLPPELIAQTPLQNRDASRLMLLNKRTGEIEHRHFKEIIKFLNPGDCLVLNNTRVIPARLFGVRENSGAQIEFLLLKRIHDNQWETLVKPGKRAKIGDTIIFGEGLLKAKIIALAEEGARVVEFEYSGIFEEILDQLGTMPLPHYIKESLADKERYQTVYAKHEGSAAAPTAGLHFTQELLQAIQEKGVEIAFVTLHVGLGTFRPVKADNILDHKMHGEYYVMTEETAEKINKTKENGGRVIAVGTTSIRTLESIANDYGSIRPCSGWTEIFIYPGYSFKVVDCLITNFHLPESTLIMLVSALSTREIILNAYNEAVQQQYRFFSFGDAMFIY